MAVRHYAADPHEQSLDSCLCGRRGRTADRAGPQSPFVSGGQVTARLMSYSSSGWRDGAGENDVALNRHGCSASAAYTNPRCNHMHPNVPRIFEISNKESSNFRGFFMELAGLEPATSWVRSRRSLGLDLAWLSGSMLAWTLPQHLPQQSAPRFQESRGLSEPSHFPVGTDEQDQQHRSPAALPPAPQIYRDEPSGSATPRKRDVHPGPPIDAILRALP
jgi:hypothetical protein